MTWIPFFVAVSILFAAAAWRLILRPWHLSWGASEDELARPLPGDDVVSRPNAMHTRAIDIEAPAERVFPWLLQIGQGRGGFYSYDDLENLFGLDIHSVDNLNPELMALAKGDIIRLAPEAAEGQPSAPAFRVHRIDPGRALILHSADEHTGRPSDVQDPGVWAAESSWAFVIEPNGMDRSRLLIRERSRRKPDLSAKAFWGMVDAASFVMERKMLHGIKERAEQNA